MATPFITKSWTNSPSTTTPISAAALIDLETRLSNFSRLTPTNVLSGPHTAVDGEFGICSVTGALTVNLPAPAVSAMVGVITINGVVTITTPSGFIMGPGYAQTAALTSVTLSALGSYAVLLSDGTSWYVIAGSPNTTGSSIIATSEARTNTAYGTLTTPDQVTGLVLPTSGLIAVWYQATWQESVAGAARAAVFVGANQLKVQSGGSVVAQAAATSASSASVNSPISTAPVGLISVKSAFSTADVTTGQVVSVGAQGGAVPATWDAGGSVFTSTDGVGGPCYVFAAAGTYTIGVQFKASSGSVTASNRRLYVQALPF